MLLDSLVSLGSERYRWRKWWQADSESIYDCMLINKLDENEAVEENKFYKTSIK